MVRLVWCVVVSLVISCGDNITEPAPDLEVSTTSINLAAGDTTSITVSNAIGDITFTSSNSDVVTVTPVGDAALVRAVGVGTATITIKAGTLDAQQRATIAVTITAA